MSAQSWSVKGIDPKVREAVREAAAKQGMSLGEYLNQALQRENEAKDQEEQQQSARQPLRPVRPTRPLLSQQSDEMEDWLLTAPTDMTRNADPARMNQRVDAIERRTQLAVTGLDRAVSTIDRSVLGLAGRVDDAELIARESADRVSDALEQFREAGEILAGRLNDAEVEAVHSREALLAAAEAFSAARAELGAKVDAADEIARKAEHDARALAREVQERDAALSERLEGVDHETKYAIGSGLTAARAAAETAAREAAIVASDAVEQLRMLQDAIARRLDESEADTQARLQAAIEHTHTAHEALIDRVARSESDMRRGHESLAERVAGFETTSRFAVEEAANEIRAAQSTLAQRLEKIEQSSRESTAGLRQAAGSAIADLRNAQLGLSARLKLVEETAGAGGAAGEVDLSAVYAAQAELNDRLTHIEALAGNPELAARLTQLEQAHDTLEPEVFARIERLEASEQQSVVNEALARFEARLQEVANRPAGVDDAVHTRLDDIWNRIGAQEAQVAEAHGATRTLETSLQRLAERIAETESTANNAIRTLEETVAGLGAQAASQSAHEETEALRAMLEQRLSDMANNVTDMVQGVRAELVEKAQTAAEKGASLGADQVVGLEGALEDVNRRLAAAERRQAQTIEAISVEIKRMSETVDRRLRAVETKTPDTSGSDASATAVREEVMRLAKALEGRFEEIERREAAAFDRMGIEVGRLSERIEDRFATVEGRSAQAIEQVGEQVARMAERFNQRQDSLARELGERVLDSEERSAARISDAISGMMQRLSEVEEHSVEAVTPVARAMSTVASRLQALEDHEDHDIPTPARRQEDAPTQAAPTAFAPMPPALFGEKEDFAFEEDEEPAPPPLALDAHEAAEEDFYDLGDDDDGETTFVAPVIEEAPVRAGPMPPLAAQETKSIDSDAFLDDDSDLASIDADDATALWSDDDAVTASPAEEAALFGEAPEAAPARNDYLANARRAAQSQSQPRGKEKEKKDYTTPAYSLRGSSRVVLWGAAGAIALLVAGGAYVMNQRGGDASVDQAPTPTPAAPEAFEPPAPAPVAVDPTAVEGAVDPTLTPEGAVVDPHAAPTAAAAPAAGTPVAAARPPGAASQATAVAQPLPPRGSVSLDQAAARGDAVAQYELGLQRISAGRAPDGVGLLRQAANQGLAMAQYRLAKLYERGEGVGADLAQARAWTERAAAAGNRRAMHDLGVYFARGEGAPLDEAAAFRWFRQAAELGVADSQFNLGVLYQQGRGVGANPSEALFWYLVAARQGDADAGARATQLEGSLQPIQVEQARARASAFRPRAASARANGEFGPRPWAAPAAARPAA